MSTPREPGSYWQVVDGSSRKRKQSTRAKDAEESNKPDTTSSTNRFAPLKRASPDGDYTDEEDDEDEDSGSGTDNNVIDVDADEEVESLGAEVAGTLSRQMPQLPTKRPKKPKPVAQGGSQVKDKAPAKKKRKTTDAADVSQPAVQQPASTTASTASAQVPAQQDMAADVQQSTRKTGLIWNFYRKSEFNRNGETGPAGSKHWKCAHCNYVTTMTQYLLRRLFRSRITL
ncbi:hypothetical protein EXIGLDRAFT_253470 [Exidia glandulosa HHB12029]|uniref:Uncharacterized protein n=1 Tax=Exidia glandulosa HHB12029 TaxID=1314781 RepID=A0A165DXQ5_EXIGL|nr:hypothetical protein EXIGLDRAFT_253470 [Exidia glandulosa HHB12029]